jgi:hypothetical protein
MLLYLGEKKGEGHKCDHVSSPAIEISIEGGYWKSGWRFFKGVRTTRKHEKILFADADRYSMDITMPTVLTHLRFT